MALIFFYADLSACDFVCPQNTILDTLNFYEFLGEKVKNSTYVFSGSYDSVFYKVRDTVPATALSGAYVRYYQMGAFTVKDKFKGAFIPDAFTWIEKSGCRKMETGSFLCNATDCDWLDEQFPFYSAKVLVFSDSLDEKGRPGIRTDVEYYCWDRRALRQWFEIRSDTILYKSEYALMPEFQRIVRQVLAERLPLNYDDFPINVSPNPFNPSNTLFFSRKLKSADLLVYDICGRYIFRLENVSGGKVRIDLFNEPAGLYIIRIKMGDAVHTKKVLFFK